MSSQPTLVTVKRLLAVALAIVIVVAAGVVVGQAPAIFGVEEEPTASITFTDQDGDGEAVTIDEVALSDGGFVVITDDDGAQLAVSEPLEAGTHEELTIERDDSPELIGQLTATVHQDTTDDGEFGYEEADGEEDQPYLDDGFPVSETAVVTADDEEVTVTETFLVEMVDTPESAETDETVTITAVIENPTDRESQEPVEVRVDGELYEQQLVDLSPGESQEITADIDMGGFDPGERAVGVYTEGDGAISDLELTFHTDPTVAVTEVTDDELTVDVATPDAGFVGLTEPETDELLATSDELEPGEHENVTLTLDDNHSNDDLVVALFAGDLDDPEAATPVEHDGEPVATTATLEED